MGDNATDPSALAWTVAFQNATNVTSYEGIGLPTVLEANLTILGNVTMTGQVSNGAGNASLAPLALTVVAPELGPTDPCDGATFEPVAISGSFRAAVSGVGFYSSNPFTVPECVTSLYAEITGDTAMYDIMLRIRDSGNDREFA